MVVTSQGRRPERDTGQVSYTHEALITLRPSGFFSTTVPTAEVHEEIPNNALVSHAFAVKEGRNLSEKPAASYAVAFLSRLW